MSYLVHNVFSTDINECLQNPCDQNCHNTEGSYICSCNEGYMKKGDKCNGIFPHLVKSKTLQHYHTNYTLNQIEIYFLNL